MKRSLWMAIGAALLLLVSGASAQSLGEVARSNRKGKPQQVATRHFDNDNLPKTDHLSVVGQAPASDASASDANAGQPAAPNSAPADVKPEADAKAQAAERDKANQDWQKKIEAQKKKVDTTSQDLELTQREYRLKAVAMYSDAGNRLRNAAQWDKEDQEYKKKLEEKQKAVDAAKRELEDMIEQARKAGVPSRMRE